MKILHTVIWLTSWYPLLGLSQKNGSATATATEPWTVLSKLLYTVTSASIHTVEQREDKNLKGEALVFFVLFPDEDFFC